MAITKKNLKTKPVCKVKFHISAAEAGEAQNISLCGDFNQWDPASHPMRRQKSGDFSLELELPTGTTQRFRYFTDTLLWLNDAEADGYEHCAFAHADNSLLYL